VSRIEGEGKQVGDVETSIGKVYDGIADRIVCLLVSEPPQEALHAPLGSLTELKILSDLRRVVSENRAGVSVDVAEAVHEGQLLWPLLGQDRITISQLLLGRAR
jgi:hypothetical protein